MTAFMKLYKYFYPQYSFKSIDDIDCGMFKTLEIKFVLLDIDNTLVPYTSPYPDGRAIKFLNSLKENGISFCFVSNNSRERIEKFNTNIGAAYFPNAKKPLLYGINEAMASLGAEKSNTALIGDQIFTDIWGGKRAGITTILVEPIKECESLFFRFKRYFEKKVIREYNKQRSE